MTEMNIIGVNPPRLSEAFALTEWRGLFVFRAE